MKSRTLVATAVAAALVTAVYAAEVNLEGIKCVVAGKPAKAGTEVDYKGGKVYFCCMNCPKTFKASPEKFATKANHQLVATGQATEIKCPLTGKDLNPETAIQVAGAKVAFCCNNCQGKVEKASGEEQLELVFNDKAFEKGFRVGKSQ
jgi:YHS domain-containing protein